MDRLNDDAILEMMLQTSSSSDLKNLCMVNKRFLNICNSNKNIISKHLLSLNYDIKILDIITEKKISYYNLYEIMKKKLYTVVSLHSDSFIEFILHTSSLKKAKKRVHQIYDLYLDIDDRLSTFENVNNSSLSNLRHSDGTPVMFNDFTERAIKEFSEYETIPYFITAHELEAKFFVIQVKNEYQYLHDEIKKGLS